ncbi:MAG TPA: shikimate kinase [Vicinamibacterales bacterium]|nr:shikimate kinase [Vicinamibacterales bacterium]
MDSRPITLAGPGGAGKTTVGTLVAERLGIAFVDLDRRFADCVGNISTYITRFGYDAYTHQNVHLCRSLLNEDTGRSVLALSSGFMTYAPQVHDDYARLRQAVEQCPTTFILIPSLDRERCVAETVRRQLSRPFARSAASEEAVIRERFPVYMALSARKIETMRTLPVIVDEIVRAVLHAV